MSHITGNASDEIKRTLQNPGEFYQALSSTPQNPFGEAIIHRFRVTEISVDQTKEEPQKLEGRVVMETRVAEDMLNGLGSMHGGCAAFLIDMGSYLALTALSMTSTGEIHLTVSQSLDIIFHSPADLGDTIRLVNTTLMLGALAHSARTEIWNVTHYRLVASGVHIKMSSSNLPKTRL